MSGGKSVFFPPAIQDYLLAHSQAPDAVQRSLIEETRAVAGNLAIMQVSPEQGVFMELLARLMGARRAIEVGTFTGYSSLCLARGMAEEGRLLCCDLNGEWAAVARRHWERAGVAHKIDLRLAPALETLRSLPDAADFDLAFIDADKQEYPDYYEEILRRLRPGGAVLVDNVLWMGRVADPGADDEQTQAIRAFNQKLVKDDRVQVVMLPIADGLTLARKR